MQRPPKTSFDDRIQSYLDGELRPSEAAAVERLMNEKPDLRRGIETIQQVQDWVTGTRLEVPSSLTARVMEIITTEEKSAAEAESYREDSESPRNTVEAAGMDFPPSLDRPKVRGWKPSWLRFGWKWAIPAVATAVVVLVLSPLILMPPGEDVPIVVGKLARFHFQFEAPDAEEVCLVGDFNDWEICRTPLRRGEGGMWHVMLDLKPGRYEYMLVVDNKWVTDPDAPAHVDDGFGHRNGVLVL
jgi:hypothetical protein